ARMTGTSGAIAMATVSRVAGLPLTAVVFTDSRTRTMGEGKSTHTISPTIVFEGPYPPSFPGPEEKAGTIRSRDFVQMDDSPTRQAGFFKPNFACRYCSVRYVKPRRRAAFAMTQPDFSIA